MPYRPVAAPLAASLIFLPAIAHAAGAETGAGARFRDWIAGCDNVRSCRAIGFPADPGDGVALILDRDGASGAKPVLRLRLGRPEDEATPFEGIVELLADGTPLGRLEVGRNLRIEQQDTGLWAGDIEDPAIEAALLKALRGSRELVARRPGGETVATISLNGAAAALLFVDDRQRRIGTQGALIRSGDRPDSTVPPPPALPDEGAAPASGGRPVSKTVPAEVRRLHGEDIRKDDCDADAAKSGQPEIHRLSGRIVLYAMPCWQGAYQSSLAYYLLTEGSPARADRLRLPRPPVRPSPEEGRNPAVPGHLVTGDGYDPKLGLMFEFAKGRGVGDCGTVANWRWTGSAFVLTAYSSMPVCGGLLHDDWLTLHRSQERPQQP